MTRPTVGVLLTETARRLSGAGIPNSRMEARLLLRRAMNVSAEAIAGHPERPVPEDAENRLRALAERRAAREPMAQILGEREFWSLPFKVTADTLTPRPDSETLVEAALAWAGKHPPRSVLDLGTGSGCLLLSLLHELPSATGTGVDVSPAALAVAGENADRLGLADRAEFRTGDWTRGLEEGGYDLVVSNPPYVPDVDMPGLAPEVAAFEPLVAISGGVDGMTAYRALIPGLRRILAVNGAVFIEAGVGQADAVAALLVESGLEVFEIKKDLSGIPRVVAAKPVATES